MAPFECIPGRQWKEILLVEESWTVRLKEEMATGKSLPGFPGGSDGKESACSAGDPSSVPGQEDPLEKELDTLSSILAWRTP